MSTKKATPTSAERSRPGRRPEFRQAGRIYSSYSVNDNRLEKVLCVRADSAFVLVTENDVQILRDEGAKETPLRLTGTRKNRLKSAAAQADKVAAWAWKSKHGLSIIMARCILLAAAEFAPSASHEAIAREANAQLMALVRKLEWRIPPIELTAKAVDEILQVALVNLHA